MVHEPLLILRISKLARGDLRGVHLKVGAHEFRVAPRGNFGVNAGITQRAGRRRALGEEFLFLDDPAIPMRIQGPLPDDLTIRVALSLLYRPESRRTARSAISSPIFGCVSDSLSARLTFAGKFYRFD